jgi:hypothetical protein
MKNNLFQLLSEKGILDWSVIHMGLSGLLRETLGPPDINLIKELASHDLAQADDSDEIESLAYLASLSNLIDDEAKTMIENLSDCERSSALAIRKLRAADLDFLLKTEAIDSVYGLLGLTNFWTKWGSPDNPPHVIQGVGNDLNPAEYFTDAHFAEAIKKHKVWLANEYASFSVA